MPRDTKKYVATEQTTWLCSFGLQSRPGVGSRDSANISGHLCTKRQRALSGAVCSLLPGGHVTAGNLWDVSFGHVSFVVRCFPDFFHKLCTGPELCLMGFRSWYGWAFPDPACIIQQICRVACRASTPLVLLPVVLWQHPKKKFCEKSHLGLSYKSPFGMFTQHLASQRLTNSLYFSESCLGVHAVSCLTM